MTKPPDISVTKESYKDAALNPAGGCRAPKQLWNPTSQDWKQDGQISPETKKGIGKAINEISKEWLLTLLSSKTTLL